MVLFDFPKRLRCLQIVVNGITLFLAQSQPFLPRELVIGLCEEVEKRLSKATTEEVFPLKTLYFKRPSNRISKPHAAEVYDKLDKRWQL